MTFDRKALIAIGLEDSRNAASESAEVAVN
jgi:hypothetical protein